MAEMELKRKDARSAYRIALERLLSAIGYPEKISVADGPATLRVDGKEVFVEESAGRIVFSIELTEDESKFPSLAAYAAGRILREDAVLAYGRRSKAENQASGSRPSVLLWQDVPVDADDHTLVRVFESFADSCDWWRARVDEHGKDDSVEISEAVIRP